MNLRLRLIKITRFEFWPYWIFYIPIVPYFIYLMIKARSATFFTNVNPGIYLSGIVGESKKEILKHIPNQYKAKSIYIEKNKWDDEAIVHKVREQFNYPIILKPNIGERGNGVEKVYNEPQLLKLIQNFEGDFIIQEFIDYKHEFGLMYYRIPGTDEYTISSIVEKGFLSVKGDGKHSIKELLSQNYRAVFVWKYLEDHLSNTWDRIPENGEEIFPQPIGNHCKGTTFINANKYISKAVTDRFHSIAKEFHGFYYGRFDVKVKDPKDLETGDHLKIMELNGITSEPAHIYDPKMSLWNAYKSIVHHFGVVYRISKANSRLGHQPASWKEFSALMKKYYQQ